ncbi:hypothetical protein HYT23_06435 [Candidatus Pacearchaeota archaeon]|nr:hypothetical protein [Candidatus Pacearchaeota archaeon]
MTNQERMPRFFERRKFKDTRETSPRITMDDLARGFIAVEPRDKGRMNIPVIYQTRKMLMESGYKITEGFIEHGKYIINFEPGDLAT